MLSLVPLALLVLGVAGASVEQRSKAVTINLKSRKVTRGAVQRRALSPVEVPLADYFNGTDLQYASILSWVYTAYQCQSAGGSERSRLGRLLSSTRSISIREFFEFGSCLVPVTRAHVFALSQW